MWILRLKIKHDCIIAKRCKKFKVLCYSTLLGRFREGDIEYVSGMHYLVGETQNIKKFVEDLRKDKRVKKLEVKDNVFSLLEISKNIPSNYYNSRSFFVKPVISDIDGYEYWEIGAWEKSTLTKFAVNIKENFAEVKILQFRKSKLTEINFPIVMPMLTVQQRKAIDLAITGGYYKYPKKVSLEKLAKAMKVSLSTYQEHLRKAENKLIPLFPKLKKKPEDIRVK
ncbi:MAG: helix-turn-helix domain-containing protein [Candidatus Aenigmarchaeota archaeon]|nr:helix-turn-helix domain-containing protein [Candidatus Aenigmarchaeota archaeon]